MVVIVAAEVAAAAVLMKRGVFAEAPRVAKEPGSTAADGLLDGEFDVHTRVSSANGLKTLKKGRTFDTVWIFTSTAAERTFIDGDVGGLDWTWAMSRKGDVYAGIYHPKLTYCGESTFSFGTSGNVRDTLVVELRPTEAAEIGGEWRVTGFEATLKQHAPKASGPGGIWGVECPKSGFVAQVTGTLSEGS